MTVCKLTNGELRQRAAEHHRNAEHAPAGAHEKNAEARNQLFRDTQETLAAVYEELLGWRLKAGEEVHHG